MSIKETLEKIKPFYSLLVIILVSCIFFVLGRFSVEKNQKNPINISYPGLTQTALALTSSTTTSKTVIGEKLTAVPVQNDGPVIGSKSGKKYYFPWCGTVKRIKPENQVRFSSIEEAKSAGFVAGGNCKGLK